jgi:hypothetical protein
MSIRSVIPSAEDRAWSSRSLFDDRAEITRHGGFIPGGDVDDPGAGGHDSSRLVDILRGPDSDAYLLGLSRGDFLFGDWAAELPGDEARTLPRGADLDARIDRQDDGALVLPAVNDDAFVAGKADIAQVLPGVTGDDFLLPKDVDLPLVLPGEADGLSGFLDAPDSQESLAGFPTHMLTLDPDRGFMGGTDDLGRLHDHDGWLF